MMTVVILLVCDAAAKVTFQLTADALRSTCGHNISSRYLPTCKTKCAPACEALSKFRPFDGCREITLPI